MGGIMKVSLKLPKLPNIAEHIRKNLVAGLLWLIPLIVTYLLLKFIFGRADNLFQPILRFIPWISEHTFGVSSAIILILMYFTGLVGNLVVGKLFLNFLLHKIPQHIPVVNKVYSLLRGLTDALSPGESGKITGKVVAVKLKSFDEKPIIFGLLMAICNAKELGISDIAISDELYGSVFFSASPFPNAGQLVLFPLSSIYEVNMTQEEFWKFLASFGTVIPKNLNLKRIKYENIPQNKTPQ
jgi:uncharacterized membrane protein